MKRLSLWFAIAPLIFTACSDIALMTKGDRLFNQGDYAGAISEYEKVVDLTSKSNSPYYKLPTGDEAKKKIEVANLAISSRDHFKKGNQEFWQGNVQQAGDQYQDIDPQFLSQEENSTYEKNRKEILAMLSKQKMEVTPPAPPPETPPPTAEESAAPKAPEASMSAPLPSATDYFPLPQGWKYHYRTSIPIGTKTIYQSYLEEIQEQRTINGRKLTPIERKQTGGTAETLFYEIKGDQVYLVAEQKQNQSQPIFLEVPAIEIQSPITIGTSWPVQGKPRVIIGVESVSIAGGNYQNCLKTAELSDLVKITRWYAPNVGLVKQQKITFPGKSYESQSVVELTRLDKNP